MRGLVVFIWEQWRQSYKGLAVVFAALALYALGAWQFKGLLFYIFSNSGTLVISCAYMPALGAVALLFLQENRGRVGFAYPRRMLVLPAHTISLVAAPLLYRLAVITVFGYATGWICDTFFKELYFKGPEVLMLMTLVAAMHAFVFLVCGYGAATGTAIFLAAFAVGLPGLNYFFQNYIVNLALPPIIPPQVLLPDIGYGGIPIALIVLPYWFFVAYMGARYARSEVAEDPVGGLVKIASRVTYFDRDRTEFDSPEAAQVWFEWRRGAYLFPWLALALGVILVFTLRVTADSMLNRFLISFNVLAVAPAVIASLVGYTVTRGSSDYQWFVGARPLSTASIAKARLRAGVRAVLWSYALLSVLFIVTFKIMFWGNPIVPSLVEDLHVITSTEGTYAEGLRLLVFLSVCAVLTTWSLFWLARASGAVVWLAFAVVGIWFYSTGGALYQIDAKTGEIVSVTTPFILAMAGSLGVAGVCAIAVAVWRRYVGVPTLAIVAIVWLALAYLASQMEYAISFGGPLVLGAWMLLPFIPLASIPLTLEWQRHR